MFLENFTPTARRHPLGRSYFAKHDWYDTQVRTFELEADLFKRGNVRVYEYLWRAENGDFLRMVFDHQSWGLLEIENIDLMVSCSLAEEKLVAGIPHQVRWRVENKKPVPVPVYLSASGDPGIEIDKNEMLMVADTAEFEGTFRIDPEIEEKKKDPKAAILRTRLTVDGADLELAAGLEAQQAVDISQPQSPRSVVRPASSNIRPLR